MKIITYAVLNLDTMNWIPSLEESYLYDGPLALCDRAAPVSYTHLDVYKRQA